MITIVGCGPGSKKYLTAAARQAIDHAELLAASRSVQIRLGPVDARMITIGANTKETLDLLEDEIRVGEQPVVAVSGDPGVSSFARLVLQRFGRDNCKIIPGISSLQVCFARLGLDWTRSFVVNAHGREPDEEFSLAAQFKIIAVLNGGSGGREWIANFLKAADYTYRVWLCENMTLSGENVRELTPETIMSTEYESLSIFVLVDKEVI